ncbi:MAG: hypothetical protein NTV73_14420 [Hyphomicrobiales bacterium]|nr:hypothetical protein [Hyphomicrobiales bacterium]
MNRYLIVQEPTCTWAVFDVNDNQPALLEGRVAIGLDKHEAVKLASGANARLGVRVISLLRIAPAA